MCFRRTSKIAAGILPLLVIIATAAGDESADLQARMQGTWKATQITVGTRKDDKAKVTIVVDKADIKLTDGQTGRDEPATFTVDASKTPAHFDLKPAGAANEDVVVMGLIRVTGDQMTMAFRKEGDRPTTFDPADGVTIITLQKQSVPATKPADTQP